MTDMVADAYATMATFRTYLRQTATTDATDPDSALELLALESAARAIDRACNRRFTTTAVAATARVFTPVALEPMFGAITYPYTWWRRYVLPIDDVADTTGMTVKFDATGNGDYDTTVTAYRAGPTNAASRGLPYTQLAFDAGTYPPLFDESVEVTVHWGWTATPTTIQNANLLQAERFFKRRDAWAGVAGSPDLGNEIRLLSKLDPDVAIMVSAFRRNWGAV